MANNNLNDLFNEVITYSSDYAHLDEEQVEDMKALFISGAGAVIGEIHTALKGGEEAASNRIEELSTEVQQLGQYYLEKRLGVSADGNVES